MPSLAFPLLFISKVFLVHVLSIVEIVSTDFVRLEAGSLVIVAYSTVCTNHKSLIADKLSSVR